MVHLLHAGGHELGGFFACGGVQGVPDGVNAAGLNPLAVYEIACDVHVWERFDGDGRSCTEHKQT
jgi:hypothetical protein